MSQLILARHAQFRRAFRTDRASGFTLNVGKAFLFFALAFAIGILSFFYLVKFTEIHTKGYRLKQLEVERSKLISARESKSAQIARLRSLQQVRESNAVARMVAAPPALFLKKEGNVAQLPR